MTTKTVSVEVFNRVGTERDESLMGTHKMSKIRKRGQYKLNFSKTILWLLIFAVAMGFAVMWYQVIISLINSLFN
ncbi:hypothetical protein ACFPMF_20525 [Larkinella bovis]|uniref:Uncharacterized protein n=1 Tax=Larkinella bovis TaxID=683041 RepID=A0ABW0IH57_9BACT